MRTPAGSGEAEAARGEGTARSCPGGRRPERRCAGIGGPAPPAYREAGSLPWPGRRSGAERGSREPGAGCCREKDLPSALRGGAGGLPPAWQGPLETDGRRQKRTGRRREPAAGQGSRGTRCGIREIREQGIPHSGCREERKLPQREPVRTPVCMDSGGLRRSRQRETENREIRRAALSREARPEEPESCLARKRDPVPLSGRDALTPEEGPGILPWGEKPDPGQDPVRSPGRAADSCRGKEPDPPASA